MRLLRSVTAAVMFSLGATAWGQASAPQAAAPQASVPQPAVSAAMVLRVESIAPIKISSESGQSWLATYGSLIGSFLALAGVLWSLNVTTRNANSATRTTQQINQASIWQKANEAELKDIQTRLDGFYMPYVLLSRANKVLADDVKFRQPKPDDHRLLVQLFNKEWRDSLSAADRKIVEIVCKNADVLRTLIVDKSGLVSGIVLEYLSRASVHYHLLSLAFNNELGDDSSRFAKYVYPRQLNEVLELEIERLNDRAQQLRHDPSGRHDPAAPLVIPDRLKPESSDPWVAAT
jgi:hypothetical protein